MSAKFSIPIEGKGKLLVFEKSFRTTQCSKAIYHGNQFDSDIIPKSVYKNIAAMINEAYKCGCIDERERISKAYKNFTGLLS